MSKLQTELRDAINRDPTLWAVYSMCEMYNIPREEMLTNMVVMLESALRNSEARLTAGITNNLAPEVVVTAGETAVKD